VNEVMNLRVAYNSGNFLTSWKPVSSCSRILHHGISKKAISSIPRYLFTKGCLNSVVSTTSVLALFQIYATKQLRTAPFCLLSFQ